MKKQTNGTVQTKLSHFLFHYRLTPNSTTGVAPAELMLKCQPRSHLDSILPSMKRNVEQQQQKQKSQHDAHSWVRVFKREDLVLVRFIMIIMISYYIFYRQLRLFICINNSEGSCHITIHLIWVIISQWTLILSSYYNQLWYSWSAFASQLSLSKYLATWRLHWITGTRILSKCLHSLSLFYCLFVVVFYLFVVICLHCNQSFTVWQC